MKVKKWRPHQLVADSCLVYMPEVPRPVLRVTAPDGRVVLAIERVEEVAHSELANAQRKQQQREQSDSSLLREVRWMQASRSRKGRGGADYGGSFGTSA